MTDNEKRLILIRHGESLHNRDGNKLSGITDIPLSEKGIEQCRQLSQSINRFAIQKVFSSPLTRAVHSATLIFPDRDISMDEGLLEFNYGDYEGVMAKNNNDPVINQWNNFPGNLSFPGGGNIPEHAQRAIESLVQIAENNKEDLIACITHRTTTRLIVAKVLGLSLDKFRSIPCSNCSITELVINSSQELSLVSLNITLNYFLKSKGI